MIFIAFSFSFSCACILSSSSIKRKSNWTYGAMPHTLNYAILILTLRDKTINSSILKKEFLHYFAHKVVSTHLKFMVLLNIHFNKCFTILHITKVFSLFSGLEKLLLNDSVKTLSMCSVAMPLVLIFALIVCKSYCPK